MNHSLTPQKARVVARRWQAGLWLLLSACTGIGSVHAQTVEYIHTDALGTPVAVTDANRNVIERSEYEPYGKVLNRALKDGPGYTGHVEDAATGLTYMQQRYYDPMLGRFLSVDPVTANSGTGANFNRYWYANNNPYKFFDPDGRLGCTGTRIQSTCDRGGVAGLQTSARSVGPIGDISSNGGPGKSVPQAPGVMRSEPSSSTGNSLFKNGNIFDFGALAHDVLIPLMNSPGGSGFSLAGVGLTAIRLGFNEVRLADGGMTILKTGHYASRLESAGLNVARTEAIISREAARIAPNLATGADVYGRMRVNGVLVEYGMRKLPDGRINIGTIYPVK